MKPLSQISLHSHIGNLVSSFSLDNLKQTFLELRDFCKQTFGEDLWNFVCTEFSGETYTNNEEAVLDMSFENLDWKLESVLWFQKIFYNFSLALYSEDSTRKMSADTLFKTENTVSEIEKIKQIYSYRKSAYKNINLFYDFYEKNKQNFECEGIILPKIENYFFENFQEFNFYCFIDKSIYFYRESQSNIQKVFESEIPTRFPRFEEILARIENPDIADKTVENLFLKEVKFAIAKLSALKSAMEFTFAALPENFLTIFDTEKVSGENVKYFEERIKRNIFEKFSKDAKLHFDKSRQWYERIIATIDNAAEVLSYNLEINTKNPFFNPFL